MQFTPQQKADLRAALHGAIESGMAHGVPEGSPPLPPTRERINQAAYWSMSAVERSLLHHNTAAVNKRARLEEQIRRLEADNAHLRTQDAIATRDAQIRDLQTRLATARDELTTALTTTHAPTPSADRGRDTSRALTEARTVHKRALAAISLIDGLDTTTAPHHDPAEVDPDTTLIRAALSQAVHLLDPWKRTGRTKRN